MRDFYEANKGALKTAIIMIILTLVILVITSVIDNFRNATTPKKVLDALAKSYYEETFHPTVVENNSTSFATVLAKYEKDGIKMSIKNFMTLYKDIDFDIFNKGKYASCDLDLTYVIIYPKSPYGVEDYTLKEEVYCNVGSVVEEDGKKDTNPTETTPSEGKGEK